jgi:hypothetical protein
MPIFRRKREQHFGQKGNGVIVRTTKGELTFSEPMPAYQASWAGMTPQYAYWENRAGVYLIYRKGDLKYIGKSKRLGKRICQHFIDALWLDQLDDYSVCFLETDEAGRMESFLINELTPPLNVVGSKARRHLDYLEKLYSLPSACRRAAA